jgi:hypothetical protein
MPGDAFMKFFKLFCKIGLHSCKPKIELDWKNTKNGEVPFILRKKCIWCGHIKLKMKGTMSNM